MYLPAADVSFIAQSITRCDTLLVQNYRCLWRGAYFFLLEQSPKLRPMALVGQSMSEAGEDNETSSEDGF